jgi:hypothetical protein
MSRLASVFVIGVLLVIAGVTVFFTYIGRIGEVVASTIGTFTLVAITAWYAWSTRRLLRVTQDQTEATRASFAPHIDARLSSRGSDFFSVDLVNRGHGVATNIEIQTRVYVDPRSAITPDRIPGKYYEFVVHVNQSLPSGSSLG